MVLMLLAMGMKLLISHNATPTTISAMTMLIRGIFFYSPDCEVAIRCPIAGGLRELS
jgi:hypothetical protein